MVKGLNGLGVGIEEIRTTIDGIEELQWKVTPSVLRGNSSIDVGNAGTVMRFLPPFAALAKGDISFDGDPRSHERPLGPVIKALEDLGISISHDGRYSLPMVLHGSGEIPGGELVIDASASSQFLSALLLIAPSMKNGLSAHHVGAPLPSMPHIEMTVEMLRDFGAKVVVDTISQTWTVQSGELKGKELVIEPDLSNAAPFLSIAMVSGGSITIADWPLKTTQPGDQLRTILSRMGAKVELHAEGLRVTGTGKISGIDIDLHDVLHRTFVVLVICVYTKQIALQPLLVR
jgi:3-phosphoshikimate 1-carboxyvinyltransferase